MGDSQNGPTNGPSAEDYYATHANELRRYVRKLVQDEQLANDIVQIAFTRLIESKKPIESEQAKAWLFRVATNESYLVSRKKGVERRARESMAHQIKVGDTRSLDRSASLHAIENETRRRLKDAIDELPERQREVVRFRMLDNLTYVEIAKRLDVPIGTIQTRMRLALRRLANSLPDLRHENER